MSRTRGMWSLATLIAAILVAVVGLLPAQNKKKEDKDEPRLINIKPRHISEDKSVKYDYDIVYVRGLRRKDGKEARWSEFSKPTMMEPGADLMLLHPDGKEEVLVEGKDGSVMDPYVSFDGEWVFYSKYVDAKHTGSDIYKIHVPSRKIVRLTNQTYTPNTGAADWAKDFVTPEKGKTAMRYGVFNSGPCPVPGGKVAFTSSRNAHVPPRGYPRVTLQLFLMDDDGSNVEQTGYINIACALHPVILRDGRLIFCTLESHGMHNSIMWGIWSIHPDGTNWAPVISAFETGGAPSAYHFQTQLSDGQIVIEKYYNQNQKGFGTLFTMPEDTPRGFGPGDLKDERNAVVFTDPSGKERKHVVPFSTKGMKLITPWIGWSDRPSYPQNLQDEKSTRIGKVTHPCGAPNNDLLCAWTLGPIGGSSGAVRDFMHPKIIDSGICLIKGGKETREPGDMLVIKNDPKYNEQWPRPLVSYERIYGVKEPKNLVHQNAGKKNKALPEGTPFGLVGTSSMYKRESAPGGKVPEGSVTAVSGSDKPNSWFWSPWRTNWALQGSDAGIYDNSEIHAIRIVAQEPRTAIRGDKGAPLYASHALERLRILGEIPVRKFSKDGTEPLDPDGNPDTSFLAKLPADQAFTFQLVDKRGMTLTMAQTWHQLRPGEVRYDCGGCHAHSQKPTAFEDTLAANPDYKIFDLTAETPLLTDKARDESKRQWNAKNDTGLRTVKSGVVNVEYKRDILPIFARSCVACHSHKLDKPAAGLILDDDDAGKPQPAFGHDSGPSVDVPPAYFRLTTWKRYTKPPVGLMVTPKAASRYITKFQSRRSLLAWKIFGKRLDGWTNNDFPSYGKVGEEKSIVWKDGKPVEGLNYNDEKEFDKFKRSHIIDQDYTGSIMPPPAAVKAGKVQPLTDEDRRTLVRWIDLGCPIDVDPQYDPKSPKSRSFGWIGDDQRPTLTLTYPDKGANKPIERILIGMTDVYTGLDMDSFTVTADFPLEGLAPGKNLAARFKQKDTGIWELKLEKPLTKLSKGTLTVSVKDRQGNIQKIERKFSVSN